MKIVFLSILTLAILSCSLLANMNGEAKDVSIIQLIANPDKYDGEKIRTIGFLEIEFEGTAIYLHKEDCERMITKNGIWLEFDKYPDNSDSLNHKYIIVEGIFDSENTGHLAMWNGAIKDIERLEIYERIE